MKVNTLGRCTVGRMLDSAIETQIVKSFNATCLGKKECELPIDISTMFDATCQEEIVRRQLGQ